MIQASLPTLNPHLPPTIPDFLIPGYFDSITFSFYTFYDSGVLTHSCTHFGCLPQNNPLVPSFSVCSLTSGSHTGVTPCQLVLLCLAPARERIWILFFLLTYNFTTVLLLIPGFQQHWRARPHFLNPSHLPTGHHVFLILSELTEYILRTTSLT